MECVTSSERHFVNISMCMLVACVYSSIKYISFQTTALAVSVRTVHVAVCPCIRYSWYHCVISRLCVPYALYEVVCTMSVNVCVCVCADRTCIESFSKIYTSLLQFIVRALSYERRTLSPTTVLLFSCTNILLYI